MSADRYSSLDEPALRKLLEVTDDFDERKLIRSTIYELRRNELKRTEETLSSKRFRSERTNKCLEDKENHLRSHRQEEDQKGSLDKLSGKLESISDIDELTTLLRNAGEYEERKLIRAAMRKLREQEIEAASIGDRLIGRPVHNGAQEIEKKSTVYRQDITPQTVCSNKDHLAKCEENVLRTLVVDTEDLEPRPKIRAQIQDLWNQKNSSHSELDEMTSSMVVVQDPLKNIDDSSMKSVQTFQQRATSSVLDPCICSTVSDWDSESGKGSKGGLLPENPRTSESCLTIQTQPTVKLQKRTESSSSMAEDDDAALRKNGCSSVNNSKNTFAPKTEPTVLQAEISSQNGMLTSVQKRLHSELIDNISPITARRASDKEQGETLFTGLDKVITFKDKMPRNTATQSKQKELTEIAIDSYLNSSPFRRTNSVQDRMKKFTVDSSNQSAELGTNFSTQKRNQLNESRSSRILQRQQPLSGSPALKMKESGSLSAETSLKGNSDDVRNVQEVDKSTAKTDKQNEHLLSGRNKKLNGSSKRNGIERDRSASLRENTSSSEQVDGKDFPKSGNKLTYSSAKSNFSTPEVQPQGSRAASSVSSSESLLSHRNRTAIPVDGSNKSTLPLFSFEKDCNKKSFTQKSATDKSYIRTPGRSNINKSQTYQPASEKDSSKTHTDSSVHLEQPRSAEPSDFHATPSRHFQQSFSRQSEREKQLSSNENNMKTLMTIEIKDGRNPDLITTRISGTPSSQRGELTFGLRATPFRMMGPSGIMMETEQVMTETAQSLQFEPTLPNGVDEKEKENAKEKSSTVVQDDLSAIEDEEVLDKMLDLTSDFEKRKMIRAAMRELRKKKRDEREREREMRLQEMKQKTEEAKKAKSLNTAEMIVSKTEKSADGKIVTSMSKTERITQSGCGNRTLQTTTVESSVTKKTDGGTSVLQTKFSSSSTSSKKVGSIFDREDDARSSSLLALERKQAEKRKEVLRSQTLPRTSGSQARKALIEKLEKEGGSPGNPAFSKVRIQRSSSCGVPNANSIKQMLLDWCRAKTRGYENVSIQNFSSSWSDGMAFCALVHNFFPETFDYAELKPNNPRHNFEVAFTMAEKYADCPQLLDVEDMVRMKEPDWKCVYTYIQEYYRSLVQKGLVKTKASS